MNKQKKRSTFGLGLNQLADLLGLAAGDRAPTEADAVDHQIAETLQRQLNEVMPGNSLLLATMSKIAATDLPAMVSKSLLQVLSSSESSVSQLQAVKEASKGISIAAVSEQERAVATTIYHAAIASCLVHHDKKISQHSYDKLDESFAILIEKNWLLQELAELFSNARGICRAKRSEE